MTRDQYVKWLKLLDENLNFDALVDGKEEVDMHEMIFDLCEELEQEPCDAVGREAVLNTIENMDKALDTRRTVKSYKELLVACMKALPSVQPCTVTEFADRCMECGKLLGNMIMIKQCEDCISREAALNCFTATRLKKFDFILYAREQIKALPPVHPKQRTGRWIPHYDRWGDKETTLVSTLSCYECSICGSKNDYNVDAYCHNCGAKMEVI